MFKKYRYYVLLMLFLASFINYMDRAALSIVAPLISKEFSLNAAEMGMIFSSFFLGYAIFNFIGGYLADIYGPRKIFTGAMSFWSLFAGLTALTTGFTSLFLCRVLFGVGEGPIGSSTNKTVNTWFPAIERARAVGIAISAMPLGAALTGPIIGFITLQTSWRVAFIVLMIFGLAWSAVWLKTVGESPRKSKRISAEEIEEIERGQVTEIVTTGKTSLSYFLRQPPIIAAAIGMFSTNYVLYFFLTWFPSYLVTTYHLSLKDMSIVTVIPWIVGMVAQAGGGMISDYIYKRTGKLLYSRKIVIVVGLFICAVGISLCGIATTTTSAVALMTIGIFAQYLTISNFWAIVQDTVPSEHVGGAGGFVHFISNLSGIIAPAATGFIIQYTDSYSSGFFIAGSVAIIGLLAIASWVKVPKITSGYEKYSGI